MLLDIDKVCKKHNIEYYLYYGSVLGAVRHNGFIPWDDDIDIALKYADYHIKRLYEYISNNYKDTILCIAADHGSSYTFAPTHFPLVNNINKENYHIPFIILNSSKHNGLIKKLFKFKRYSIYFIRFS